jgi:endonuclease VIII
VPEGDTIHRTAAALRAALLGKPTAAFEAPRLTGLQPSIGAVIERVESKGKHLEIGWDDGVVLHTHLRMSGSWHLYRPGERWRKSHNAMRVVIEVPGFQAVCFSAPVVETYRARSFSHHPGLGTLGPDLVREDADLDECVTRMGRYCERDKTVADALLDQRVACGVGNVYKSEILWACELHPFTPMGALDDEQRRRLVEVAGQLLRANLDGPGRITVPGTPDGLAVYGRFGKPCLRCGQPIEVRKHGEQARVTYWCPGCQLLLSLPEPDPTDADAADDRAGRRWFGRRRRDAERPDEPDEPHSTMRVFDVELDDVAGVEGVVVLHSASAPDDELAALAVGVSPSVAKADRHPAAQRFMASRPNRVEPAFLDPLLARHSGG